MTRSEGARTVARRLSERVAAVAPERIGAWGPAWDMVERPSEAFLEALHRWEVAVDPDPRAEEALRDDVRSAGDAVVEAWREAARRWERAGRPVVPWRPQEPVEVGR